ncbi:MAG: helix-turn-helix domain-containing protein [Oscillospiraceae bacterium]|nr:helix-turn-helix domain-containing protein [Oscillospiraceae bacterium]
MTEEFIRERIDELRVFRGVSEYKMSLDLGRSRSYIQNISSGRCLPPLKELIQIVEYFGITLSEFFNRDVKHSDLTVKAIQGVKALKDDDLEVVLGVIERLRFMNEVVEDFKKSNQEKEPQSKATRI